MKLDRNTTINWILVITVATLALICSAVVVVLLSGLFIEGVDNDKIFDLIGPAFNTVIGAFVGLIGGISISNASNDK